MRSLDMRAPRRTDFGVRKGVLMFTFFGVFGKLPVPWLMGDIVGSSDNFRWY